LYGEDVMGDKVNTQRAAQFLTDLGKPTKETTLNTLRSTGEGPPFYKTPRKKHIVYDTDELAEYAKIDPLVRYTSTSEYSTRKKKTPKPNGAPPEDKSSEDKPSDPSTDDVEGA
jgi:hypothetical protein